jgi:cellulose synthase/poly-beta-1,6-N-acetylglucosamine synthase-like glycosyltransferase
MIEGVIIGLVALILAEYAAFVRRVVWRDRASDQTAPVADLPELTVLIPCRNEAENLETLLQDLARQTHPVKVLVIDDHSEDSTKCIGEQAGRSVRCIPSDGFGKKAALATGHAQVQTPWMATLDADVRLEPGWAAAMLGATANSAAVIGPVAIDAEPSDSWERFQALEYGAMMAWIAVGLQQGSLAMGSGANSLYATAEYPVESLHLEKASGDDGFALLALKQTGKRITWCNVSEALVVTRPVPKWKALWQQRARWASKTSGQDAATKRAAMRVAVHHIVGVALCGLSLIDPRGWQVAGAFWLFKALLDGGMIRGAARKFGLAWCPIDRLTFTPRYAILVLGAWWELLTQQVDWKGRRI